MYFFDFKGLVNYLKHNKPTARDNYHYLFGILVLNVFYPLWRLAIGASNQPMTFGPLIVGSLIGFGFSVLILNGLYTCNGGDKGECFLDRMLALNWVLGLRIATPIVPLALVVVNVIESQGAGSTLALVLAISLALVGIGAFIYWLVSLRNALKEIASYPSKSTQDELVSRDPIN